MTQLTELPEEECRRLLVSDEIGRVALTTPDGPYIVPVTYIVADDSVLFATGAHTLLAQHGREALLALEVDQVDYESSHGWSVLVSGRSEVVTDADELEAVTGKDSSGSPRRPEPWADGTRPLVLRLPITRISGRRLGWGWQPMAPRPNERHLDRGLGPWTRGEEGP